MSPMGRPKVDDPKTKRFSVCLDSETKDKLDDYCRKMGVSKGEAVRRGIHLLSQQKD